MKLLLFLLIIVSLTSCWPTSIAFRDVSMPPEWKTFSIKTLESSAPNAPLSYSAKLTENIKDGIQNNSRLLLKTKSTDLEEVAIEGVISSYSITPVALQQGDNAAKNRLTISVNFTIFISKPTEDKMTLTSTRFMDYNSNDDFSTEENRLIEEINQQIVQDVVNKLFSNW